MNGSEGPGASALSVSRETYERLEIFAALLRKWTARINLISQRDQDQVWTRHIQDSLQVYRAAPNTKKWVDLGSGGGFPGLIAAICAETENRTTNFTLIESDQRKATFLRTAVRECGLSVRVLSQRIEEVVPQNAGVISARALADLDTLLALASRHAAPDGTMLFPKGQSWGKEVDNARARWKFEYEAVTSKTDREAVVLIIKGVSRV